MTDAPVYVNNGAVSRDSCACLRTTVDPLLTTPLPYQWPVPLIDLRQQPARVLAEYREACAQACTRADHWTSLEYMLCYVGEQLVVSGEQERELDAAAEQCRARRSALDLGQ